MTEPSTVAPFITFYSFKGGVGRSMALINTAGILAGQRGFRVLVLDLDLEAPGLSYLNPDAAAVGAAANRRSRRSLGFVDLLTDAKAKGKDSDLFCMEAEAFETKYTKMIRIPDVMQKFAGGFVRIMPAGRFDHRYAQRLDALDINALYRMGIGEPLIRAFKRRLAELGRYDYVLVDSRTGISEGAGICTRDLADHVMVLSGLNLQNVEGTSEFLREFRAATGGKKTFQVILSPMPNGEDELLDKRRDAAERTFSEAWGEAVPVVLEIPYHPRLALTEEPHIFRRHRGYLFDAYRTIEAKMLEALGHTALSLQQRVVEHLEERQYGSALSRLDHMIRLDGGQAALGRLIENLTRTRARRQGVGAELAPEPLTFERLTSDEEGRRVLRLIIDSLELGERDALSKRLLLGLERSAPELASRLSERILEAFSGSAVLLRDFATFFEQEERFDAAEVYFKRAIDADPKDARSLMLYAGYLAARSRFSEADSLYQRAIGIGAGEAQSLVRYGDFLTGQGRFDDAETYYKRAVGADPSSVALMCKYAGFLAGRGRLKEAEVLFSRAVEAEPNDGLVLRNFAGFLTRVGRFAEAEAFLRRAVEADRGSGLALFRLAIFLEDQGRFAEAESSFQEAVRAQPWNATVLSKFASFLATRQRHGEAEVFFQRAVEADPGNGFHLYRFAEFLAQRQRFAEAEASFRRAVEAEPSNASVVSGLVAFLEERGQYGEAEAVLQRAVTAYPKNASILNRFARFLEYRGRYCEAEAVFQRAVEADPANAFVLCDYGQFLVGAGQFQQAEIRLLGAFRDLDRSITSNLAEVSFSLWLVRRLQGAEASDWERKFKSFVIHGFKRHPWSFDRMLKQAENVLSGAELEYARALAAAFVDENNVSRLMNFQRWQALEPLDFG